MREYRPPRGFRDFPPEVMLLRREVIGKIVRVFERYGYEPLDTPAVENWETLAGKYGEEAEGKLMWRFTDPWSKKEYALRYDLTVPLARFISNNMDIPLPFKRYHIAPVWRHEEPQRGRYREFYQCDVDIVGSPYPEADAEIVDVVGESLRELGFSGFRIRLNDRRLLSAVFEEELGLKDPLPVYRSIDKLDKIGAEGVRKELTRTVGESLAEKIMSLISLGGGADSMRAICSRYSHNAKAKEACDHLEQLTSLAGEVTFDLSLVRGLDYYTGPILEVVLDQPKIGSVAGGGRYDKLIGTFTGKDIPATGASLGIERLIDAGVELGILKASRSTVTDVYLVVVDWSFLSYAWRAAKELRRSGLNVRIDPARASEESQRKRARRLGVPVIAFVGMSEAETNSLTLYSPAKGERAVVKLEEAPLVVRRFLS
ncbi:MAG: histidine--tRNA ligase [Acidilobaceae archaeon]|nr:histidine--tRNA ligase [Acidilobaceae archaeon]MDW7973896.1 histidine--tRNA ligase [Sulfolobales archaeon]